MNWREISNKVWAARRMMGIEAMRKNLALDRQQRERWAAANHKKIYGDAETIEDEDMGDMFLGDVTVHAAEQKQEPPSGAGSPVVPSGRAASPLVRGAAIAALLAAGAIGGPPAVRLLDTVINAFGSSPPAADTDTQYKLGGDWKPASGADRSDQ